jgi:hypothetical protein
MLTWSCWIKDSVTNKKYRFALNVLQATQVPLDSLWPKKKCLKRSSGVVLRLVKFLRVEAKVVLGVVDQAPPMETALLH